MGTEYKIEGRIAGRVLYIPVRVMSATASKGITTKRYTPPKPAPLPEDYDEFYASLSEGERELDALAKEWLASSYTIQWSHMYLKWSKAKAEKAKGANPHP